MRYHQIRRYNQIRRYKTIGRYVEKRFGKTNVSEETRSRFFKGLLIYKRAIKKLFRNEELTRDEAQWIVIIAN